MQLSATDRNTSIWAIIVVLNCNNSIHVLCNYLIYIHQVFIFICLRKKSCTCTNLSYKIKKNNWERVIGRYSYIQWHGCKRLACIFYNFNHNFYFCSAVARKLDSVVTAFIGNCIYLKPLMVGGKNVTNGYGWHLLQQD